MKADIRQALATREAWNEFRRVCEFGGHQVADEEYEAYKCFAESDDYTVDFDQTTHVQMMAKQLMDALLPKLAARYWSLGIAVEGAPDLICSDVPVSVWPNAGVDVGKPISINSANTVLSFPISRRLVAIARHEKRGPVLQVMPQGVALFNTWTLSHARQIYSPAADFAYLKPEREIGGKAELVEWRREHLDAQTP